MQANQQDCFRLFHFGNILRRGQLSQRVWRASGLFSSSEIALKCQRACVSL